MKLSPVATLTGHTGKVWCVSWSPAADLLATCGEDTNIRIWGKEGKDTNWRLLTILADSHTRTVRNVNWSRCGRYLASASFDGTVAIWDRQSGEFECTATLEGHENEVKSAAFSFSGKYLATCSRDKSVWVWDIDEEEEEYTCAAVLQGHTQDVKRVVWTHDDILASCSYDNKIKMYKEEDDDWVCFATLSSHESTVWGMAFNKEGSRLASVSEGGSLKVWRRFLPGNEEGVATEGQDPAWKCEATVSGVHERSIYDVSWCSKSDLIATACADDAIRIFQQNKSSGSCSEPTYDVAFTLHDAHTMDVNAVAWSEREKGLLASGADDGEVKLWKVEVL